MEKKKHKDKTQIYFIMQKGYLKGVSAKLT